MLLLVGIVGVLISFGSCFDSGFELKSPIQKLELMEIKLNRSDLKTHKDWRGISLESIDLQSGLLSSRFSPQTIVNSVDSSKTHWTLNTTHFENQEKGASCFRAIDWQDGSFMACSVEFFTFAGYQQHMHIFHKRRESAESTLVQIIYETRRSSIKDADFVVLSNQLFLFIAYLSNVSRLIVYRWISPYFYKETELTVNFPEKLVTINQNDYALLVLVRGVTFNKHECECEIFKLFPGSGMEFSTERKQVIRVPRTPCVHSLIFMDNNFLLITDARTGTHIYRWKDGKFTFWMKIEHLKECKAVAVGTNSLGQIAMIAYSGKRIYVFEISRDFAWRQKQFFFTKTSTIFYIKTESNLIHATLLNKDGQQEFRQINISRLFEKVDSLKLNALTERLNNLKEEVNRAKDRIDALQNHLPAVLLTNERKHIKGTIKCKQLIMRKGHAKQVLVIYPEERLSRKAQMNMVMASAVKLMRYLSKASWAPISEMRIMGNLNVLFGQVSSLVIPQLDPLQLLTYNGQQFIRAPINITNVTVNWLLTNSIHDIPINEFVLNTDVSLQGKVKVSDIECNNISFISDPVVNGININDVITTKSHSLISGVKTCPNFVAGEVNVSFTTETNYTNQNFLP